MKTSLETERLIIRELLLTDIDGMYALDADQDVHKYIGNNPVQTKEQSLEVINFIRQQYVDNGIGRWAIIDKSTNDFMGWTGLKYITEEINHHIHYYDLGYRLRKKYWGKGIASESALASLRLAFEALKASEVYAIAHIENLGSNAVLKKIGFSLKEVFEYEGSPHNWYKITKEDFEKKHQNTSL